MGNGKWAMPGGGIEKENVVRGQAKHQGGGPLEGGTAWVAAQRETWQETGLRVRWHMVSRKIDYGHPVHTAVFVLTLTDSRPRVRLSGEHSKFMWATCAEIKDLIRGGKFNTYAARSLRQARVC